MDNHDGRQCFQCFCGRVRPSTELILEVQLELVGPRLKYGVHSSWKLLNYCYLSVGSRYPHNLGPDGKP
jgi:hypothetical protein